MVKPNLKISCERKRWTIAIGRCRNILICYSRYPLEGLIDLGDFSNIDFEYLAVFFKERKPNSQIISSNNKWSFDLNNHYALRVTFKHHPFNGSIELGEISKDNCDAFYEFFMKAIHC